MEHIGERANAADFGIPGADRERIAVKEPVAVTRPGRHRRIGARARWWEEGHRVIGGSQHQEMAGFWGPAPGPPEGGGPHGIFFVRWVTEAPPVVPPPAPPRNRH